MNGMFQGKVALVTGAGSGLGLAAAQAFAAEGASVVLADVDEGAVKAAAARLVASGHQALAVRCDVADEAHARTMAFTTLILFQLFDVYNCRSRWRSAFNGFFENRWLIAAVALSLFTHVLVIYVPVLQAAFHTVALSTFDWLIATGIAATLLIGMELAKLVLRTKRPDHYAWTG